MIEGIASVVPRLPLDRASSAVQVRGAIIGCLEVLIGYVAASTLTPRQ